MTTKIGETAQSACWYRYLSQTMIQQHDFPFRGYFPSENVNEVCNLYWEKGVRTENSMPMVEGERTASRGATVAAVVAERAGGGGVVGGRVAVRVGVGVGVGGRRAGETGGLVFTTASLTTGDALFGRGTAVTRIGEGDDLTGRVAAGVQEE
jgi:hypothetical protein